MTTPAFTITTDTRSLTVALAELTNGATARIQAALVDRASAIVSAAQPRWPVATGASKAGFVITPSIEAEKIKATITNTATPRKGGKPYAYVIRWSRYSQVQIDAMVEGYAAKAATPEGAQRARDFWGRRIRRKHGRGSPEGATGRGPWQSLIADPVRAAAPDVAAQIQGELDALARSI